MTPWTSGVHFTLGLRQRGNRSKVIFSFVRSLTLLMIPIHHRNGISKVRVDVDIPHGTTTTFLSADFFFRSIDEEEEMPFLNPKALMSKYLLAPQYYAPDGR